MNTQLSKKLILRLLKRNDDYGFTWWELIFLIIFIGCLLTIIVFLFLDGSVTTKKVSAPVNINTLNKSQQAYFLENKKFAHLLKQLLLDELNNGIKAQTSNYKYSIKTTKSATYSYAIPKQTGLISYVGGVFIIPNDKQSQTIPIKILCESDSPQNEYPADPILKNSVPVCAEGTKELINKKIIK